MSGGEATRPRTGRGAAIRRFVDKRTYRRPGIGPFVRQTDLSQDRAVPAQRWRLGWIGLGPRYVVAGDASRPGSQHPEPPGLRVLGGRSRAAPPETQRLLHDGRAMPTDWVLVAYRAPAEPSTARVAAWRRLHRLGGLYIGSSVCLIPGALARDGALDRVAEGIRAAGGTFDVLVVQAFAEDAQAALAGRYNAARDAEYAEVVERAEALQVELERE